MQTKRNQVVSPQAQSRDFLLKFTNSVNSWSHQRILACAIGTEINIFGASAVLWLGTFTGSSQLAPLYWNQAWEVQNPSAEPNAIVCFRPRQALSLALSANILKNPRPNSTDRFWSWSGSGLTPIEQIFNICHPLIDSGLGHIYIYIYIFIYIYRK